MILLALLYTGEEPVSSLERTDECGSYLWRTMNN